MAEGWKMVRTTALAGTATLISKGPCKVGPIVIGNLTAATAWLQLFDAATAAAVTPGTTKPDATISVAASLSKEANLEGARFENGVVAISTTTAEGSTGANTNSSIGIG